MLPAAPPVDATAIPWVPLRAGLAFKPLHFTELGYSLLLRVGPGVTIGRHRHSGEVHAYNLEGCRELIETGDIVGPGTHVYEPPGNVDSWRGVGTVPCIIHITLTGRIEYLDAHGGVREVTDTFTARAAYLRWCAEQGVAADPALLAMTTRRDGDRPR